MRKHRVVFCASGCCCCCYWWWWSERVRSWPMLKSNLDVYKSLFDLCFCIFLPRSLPRSLSVLFCFFFWQFFFIQIHAYKYLLERFFSLLALSLAFFPRTNGKKPFWFNCILTVAVGCGCFFEAKCPFFGLTIITHIRW